MILQLNEPKVTYLITTPYRTRTTRIEWQALNKEEITEDQAITLQAKHGYHYCAYDFFKFKCEKTDQGYKATWQSYANAD